VSLTALKCNSFRKKQIIASNLKGFSVAIVFFSISRVKTANYDDLLHKKCQMPISISNM
jgi:hypothetical protein